MYVFLDFEASSLSKVSYPIEVGWVHENGSGESHLIRPAPGWTEWDDDAARIHGLSRERLLRDGEPHAAVCDRLLDVFSGNDVLVSAPSWDGHWLSMLLRAAGKPRHLVRFQSTDIAFRAAAQQRLGPEASTETVGALIDATRRAVKAAPASHRALGDARQEWEIWRRIVDGRV